MKKFTAKDAVKEFDDYYFKSMMAEHESDEPAREERLRVSGFPFCALRFAHKKLVAHLTVRKMKYGSKFHTGVGAITHEIIQQWVGMGGKVWGAWKCKRDGCEGKRELSKNPRCPVCKSYMEYEEITVVAFNNVSGHIDCIFRDSRNNWWIVDYKTTSTRTLAHQKEEPTLPYATNIAQIEAYCALVELTFDIEITGWMLHYVTRDNPLYNRMTKWGLTNAARKVEILAAIGQYDRDYELTKDLSEFSTVRKLMRLKPCSTQDEYMSKMKHFEPCPLLGVCFHKTNLQDEMKMAWMASDDAIRKL